MAIRPTRTQEQKRMDAIAAQGGSSGGVGENVGNHNERFNGYTSGTDANIIQGYGDYNHAEGYKNTIQGSYNNNHIEGSNNTMTNCNNSSVGGMQNSITGATCSLVQGNYNRTTGSLSYSAVIGNNNEVTSVHASCIVGDSHYIVGPSGGINVFVCGQYADTRTLNIPSGAGSLRFLVGGANSSGNHNVFYITHLGEVYAKGSYNSMGADYAEYFEWADGNSLNEDRTGLLVSLYGDKIELAHGDDFIGAVSVNPSMVGNAQFTNWRGRFETDVFGRTLHDECGKPIVSDEYDRKMKYIPRADRPEWSPIGLVGRLIIVDDGSCKVGGYVSARHGIGTACFAKTAAKVLKRVDETHVEVLIK